MGEVRTKPEDLMIGEKEGTGDRCQESASGPQVVHPLTMAYAPVGSQLSGDGRTDGIVLLAERVVEVVKIEVLRFFQRGEG